MTHIKTFKWTPELVDRVMKLDREGMTGTEIAKMFRTTRNVIIGKLNREKIRLGLHVPGRRGPLANPRKSSKEHSVGIPSIRSFKTDDIADEDVVEPVVLPMITKGTGEPCTIDKLCGCKWPVHEDKKLIGWHLFCNKPRPLNSPYCAEHSKKAGEKYNAWTAEDDKAVREHWRSGKGRDMLAQTLRRPKAAISARANHLGLVG